MNNLSSREDVNFGSRANKKKLLRIIVGIIFLIGAQQKIVDLKNKN